MIKTVKEYIELHYLFKEIQLYTLIILELNTYHKKYWTKSKINNYSQYNKNTRWSFYYVWNLYMLVGKTLLGYTNVFSANEYKNSDKIIYKYFKNNYGKSRV